MKFVIYEIKLWFEGNEYEPRNYEFLPNKINVITGDSTTGKTSIWNIIDYCLMSNKNTIPTEIYRKVNWFGIRFKINDKIYSIARKSPDDLSVSDEYFFNKGIFNKKPVSNIDSNSLREILNEEFNISQDLKNIFNLSYRNFLIFNSLTQSIIDTVETFFDSTFYGKEEYDRVLPNLLELATGSINIESINFSNQLKITENELDKLRRLEKKKNREQENFNLKIKNLFNKCKAYNFIEFDSDINDIQNILTIINDVISKQIVQADNSNLLLELESLNNEKRKLIAKKNSIIKYDREIKKYKDNLEKTADSLQPIIYLKNELSDQLIDSLTTKLFIDSLEVSLIEIKKNLNFKKIPINKIEGDLKLIKSEILKIDERLDILKKIDDNNKFDAQKLIKLGEIKNELSNINKDKKEIICSNNEILIHENKKNEINDILKKFSDLKIDMNILLNQSIQKYFDLINSIPKYKNSTVKFNHEKLVLQLIPQGELFPLDNLGSASNYMFLHLCLYLGLHEHMININQNNIPPFLFIDQPSKPYYEGNNDDKIKLTDAFNLLDKFMLNIVNEKKNDFQIILIEHASKEYWENNNFKFFHTVDEFKDGKGLIPEYVL